MTAAPTMTTGALAQVTGGTLVGADAPFRSVCTDTRQLSAGQLFVALRGPNFDGHAFVADASAKGAAAALVERRCEEGIPQVVVPDSRAALGAFARAWRMQFPLPVVGITGSNGKTTAKEMTAAVLERRGPTLATRGNLNNDIGVPLMLLEISGEHTAAVIEMGANHVGEIRTLAALARPQVGVVTNAGPAHLEGFGGLDGVARGKGEMFEALPADGCAVINANDRYAPYWREVAAHCRRVEFGVDVAADFTVDARDVEDDGMTQRFVARTPHGAHAFALPVPGRHNLMNALAAIACAVQAGATLEHAESALAAFGGVGGRLRRLPAVAGATVIDDSYNANPASLDAALEVLARVGGRQWVVLGDMLELGDDAAAMHARAGRRARELGIERLYAFGALAAAASAAFDGSDAFADVDEIATRIARDAEPGVTILVKGSRGMRMERIVAALTRGAGGR